MVAPAQEDLELRGRAAAAVRIAQRRQQPRDVRVAFGQRVEDRAGSSFEHQDRGGDFVDMDNRARAVEDDQAVLDAFDNRVDLRALMVQLGDASLVIARRRRVDRRRQTANLAA